VDIFNSQGVLMSLRLRADGNYGYSFLFEGKPHKGSTFTHIKEDAQQFEVGVLEQLKANSTRERTPAEQASDMISEGRVDEFCAGAVELLMAARQRCHFPSAVMQVLHCDKWVAYVYDTTNSPEVRVLRSTYPALFETTQQQWPEWAKGGRK
jgi:hypothetical protein